MSSEEFTKCTYPNWPEEGLDVLWANNNARKEKVREYRNEVKELFRDAKCKGVCAWDTKFALGQWRAMIIEVDDKDQRERFPLNDAKEFVEYWDNNPRDETKVSRRMIILEEIHPRILELLSVELGIGPEFAIVQAHRPYTSSMPVDWNPVTKTTQYWKVDVIEWIAGLSNAPKVYGAYLLTSGGMYRTTMKKDENDQRFPLPISFWGTSQRNGSWTSVLIFDSPNFVLCKRQTLETQIRELYTARVPWKVREFKKDLSHSDCEDRKNTRSIFDSYFNNYNSLILTDDPFTGTYLARNYIRQQWQAFARHQVNFIDANSRHVLDLASKIEGKEVDSYKKDEIRRQWLQKRMSTFDELMWNFGYRDRDFISRQLHKQPKEQRQELRYILIGETKQCLRIEEKLKQADTWLANNMNMWAQSAALKLAEQARNQTKQSIEHTKQANKQTAVANRVAHNSGQLTMLATVIVPFSLVSSLFSMNGKFAAGEKFFFVYWVISIPITSILLIWVLSEDIQKTLCWMKFRLDKKENAFRKEKQALREMKGEDKPLCILRQERKVLDMERDVRQREWNIKRMEFKTPRTKENVDRERQAKKEWDDIRRKLDSNIQELDDRISKKVNPQGKSKGSEGGPTGQETQSEHMV